MPKKTKKSSGKVKVTICGDAGALISFVLTSTSPGITYIPSPPLEPLAFKITKVVLERI